AQRWSSFPTISIRWRVSARASSGCRKGVSPRMAVRPASSPAIDRLRNPIEVLRLSHIRYSVDAIERALRDRRVDVDLHERVLAALLARAIQRRDVDSFVGDDARHLG